MLDINKTTKKYNLRGQLMEVFLITEFKDGCVYKTESIGFVVCSHYQSCVDTNKAVLSSIGTKDMKRLIDAP